MHLMKQIIFQARQHEDEAAVATPGAVINYRTLAKSVLSAADALVQHGVGRGSLVTVGVADPLQHLYLLIALGLLGAPSASSWGASGLSGAGPQPHLVLTGADGTELPAPAAVRVGGSWFATDAKAAPDYIRLLALPGFAAADDVARYLFSSGTTGHPKCIGFTAEILERRLLANTIVFSGRNSLRGPTLNLMGLATVSGFVSAVRTLASGGLLCLPRGVPSAVEMIRLF